MVRFIVPQTLGLGALVFSVFVLSACGNNEETIDVGSQDVGGQDTSRRDTGTNDTGSNDTGSNDTGSNDTGSNDTGSNDTGSNDTGSNDTGTVDSGGGDSGTGDGGGVDTGGDTGSVDTGGVDAGGVDAGGVDAGGVDTGGVDAGAACSFADGFYKLTAVTAGLQCVATNMFVENCSFFNMMNQMEYSCAGDTVTGVCDLAASCGCTVGTGASSREITWNDTADTATVTGGGSTAPCVFMVTMP